MQTSYPTSQMNIQNLSYQPITRTDHQYAPQLLNAPMPYQPVQVYYNMMVPGIASNFSQPLMIQPNINNSSNTQTPFNQTQTSIQHQQTVYSQPSQQKPLQPQISSLNNFQQRLIVVSQLLTLTTEEALALLQENICICCKNSLQEKTQIEGQADTLTEKGKSFSQSSTQISSQSQKDLNQNLSLTLSIQNKSDFDKKSISDKHLNTPQLLYNQASTSQREFHLKSGKLTTISKELNQNHFDNADSSNEVSCSQQENYPDLEKVQEESSCYQQQLEKEKVTNQLYKKKGSNLFKSCQSQVKVEPKEFNFSQIQQMPILTDRNPDRRPAQYAIIKKCISKQAKESPKFNQRRALLNSSQIQNLDEQKQQQTHQMSQVLTTSLQIQKPQAITIDSLSKQQQTMQDQQDSPLKSSSINALKNSEDSLSLKQKKEYQNDSNYTKNLLKGFKRVVIKNYGQNAEFINDFKKYFDSFSLNNEFILKLFSDSPYSVYFAEFLQTDPSWWMKEARIKDTENQVEFFEICKRRQFSLIRTKRKKFIRPKLV